MEQRKNAGPGAPSDPFPFPARDIYLPPAVSWEPLLYQVFPMVAFSEPGIALKLSNLIFL